MAYVDMFIFDGPWTTVGTAQYCASAYISLDIDGSDMNTMKGYIRCGYKTKNIDAGGTFGTGYLRNSQGKQIAVTIDDHSTGWYYSSLDVQFEQACGTQLKVYSQVGHTGSSGTAYSATLDEMITLYPPCPRDFDELDLVVNGVKITQNCQVIKVDSPDDEVEISFNSYCAYGNVTPVTRLYSISYLNGYSASIAINGTQQPYRGGRPAVERLTFKDTVANILATYFGPGSAGNVGPLFQYDNEEYKCVKRGLDGNTYAIVGAGGLSNVFLVKQFYEEDKLGFGCICFTLGVTSSWGSSSSGYIYYSMGNNPAFDCKGPSFVLLVGPFIKYKDSNGIVHDAKLGYGFVNANEDNRIMVLYKGQLKDIDGAVHDIA